MVHCIGCQRCFSGQTQYWFKVPDQRPGKAGLLFDVVRCEFCCIQHTLSLVGDLSRDVRVIPRHVGLGKGRGDHGGKQPPVTKKRVHFTPIESHSQPPLDAGKPDGGKPHGGKPDGGKPDGCKQHGDKPDGGKPDDGGKLDGGKGEPANGGKPDVGKPDVGKPHGGKPDVGKGEPANGGKLDGGKPDAGKGEPANGGKPNVGKPDVGKPHGGKGEPANGGKQPHLVVGGDEAASLADTWPWLDDAGNDGADNDEAAGLAVTWPWLGDAGNDEADNAAGQAWMTGQDKCWSRLVEAGIQMGCSSSAGRDGGDPTWKSAGHASSPHDEPSGGLLVEEDLPEAQ